MFKKILKNIKANVLYQLITIALGIFIPRLVLVNLGSEANGLLNSTNQMLVYLALLEGGIGLTITQAMYKPVAEKNRNEVNGIMAASNDFYREVGTLYFIGVFIIALFYTFTVQTSFPKLTVFLVILLTGMPQVINFFFQGKYRTLLSVDGKGYVLTNMSTVFYIGTSITKILLLLNGYGVVAIQLMYFVISLLQMVFILWYVKKSYPWLDLSVKPMKEKIGKRGSVFIHQIAGYVFNSTDNIILTYFCGLKTVSVYAMYNMLFGMVNSLIGNVMGGAVFALGQIFQADRQRFLKVNNCYETLNLALTFAACSVAYICILPFMKLYTKGVTDIDYIDQLLPVLFVAIMVLQAGRDPSMRIINFAGKFKETQPHALAEMIVNLVVSILGVIRFGIYGVLFGTVAALVVRSILMIHYSYGVILQTNEFRIYRKWLINIVLLLAFERCLRLVPCQLDTYFGIFLYAAGTMIAALIVFVGSAMLYDKDARETLVEYYRELKVKKDINR